MTSWSVAGTAAGGMGSYFTSFAPLWTVAVPSGHRRSVGDIREFYHRTYGTTVLRQYARYIRKRRHFRLLVDPGGHAAQASRRSAKKAAKSASEMRTRPPIRCTGRARDLIQR